MKEANPFQFPTWSQINRVQRRRERFKRVVILVVAAAALLLFGLLIFGTKTVLAAKEVRSSAGPVTTQVATATPATVPVSSQPATAVPAQAATVYVVESGDTLSGIATTHGTTITAIKAANDLTNDCILVGEKLKIPGAMARH